MFQILHKTTIDFMGKKNISFTVSALLILLGLLALVQIGRGKANLGIDFVGGTTVQLSFKDRLPIDEARATLEKNGILGATLQEFADGNKILIRLREHEGIADKVVAMFKQAFPNRPFEVDSTTEIGPTIGKDLQVATFWALLISIVAIIIYIAIRFEFKFGVAAAIATMHDVLAVLGIFYVLHKEINLLLITALTVVIVLIPLVLLGGEVLHDFSLALLMGIIVGTYSSIFVASPLLVVWHEKAGGRLVTKR